MFFFWSFYRCLKLFLIWIFYRDIKDFAKQIVILGREPTTKHTENTTNKKKHDFANYSIKMIYTRYSKKKAIKNEHAQGKTHKFFFWKLFPHHYGLKISLFFSLWEFLKGSFGRGREGGKKERERSGRLKGKIPFYHHCDYNSWDNKSEKELVLKKTKDEWRRQHQKLWKKTHTKKKNKVFTQRWNWNPDCRHSLNAASWRTLGQPTMVKRFLFNDIVWLGSSVSFSIVIHYRYYYY